MYKNSPVLHRASSRFIDKYFHGSLDLRVQAFHLLAFAGALAGLAAAGMSLAEGAAVNVFVNLAMSALALFFVCRAQKRKAYRFYYRFTVVIVFIAAFPCMFFAGGGYHSGMPCFFILALVFTALMLEKTDRIAALAAELILYTGACLLAYCRPGTVRFFAAEKGVLIDVLTGIVVSGALVLSVILLYVRIYDNRQKQLEELERLKTEFYQDMHHEMKTPLHVISTYIQNADDMLDFDTDKSLIRNRLESAEHEIVRLARMIEHSIDVTAAQIKRRHMAPFDFAALLRVQAGIFSALAERDGNSLLTDIPAGLPCPVGNADMLSQVIFNLMENAHRHTKNGTVSVSLKQAGGMLVTAIRDTGEGIAGDLLPHVFERGVSGGGTGYGLAICKAIVEMHGGGIGIESEPGKGTAVTFTLPVKGESERGKAP